MYYPLQEGGGTTFDFLFNLAAGNIGTFDKNAARSERERIERNGYSYSSIAKAASQLIAVFPILASRTVSADAAIIVSRYIEQICCQLLMFALQQQNISTAQSGIEYLKNFHRNLDINGSGSDEAIIRAVAAWIDAYNTGKGRLYENSYSLNHPNIQEDYSWLLEGDSDLEISATDLNNLMKLMENNANIQVYDTKLNPRSINDYMVSESSGKYSVSIKPLNELMADYNENEKLHGKYKKEFDDWVKNVSKFGQVDVEQTHHQIFLKQQAEEAEEESKLNYNAKSRYHNVSFMRDQDIKKMNDATPSILVVKFYQTSGEGDKRVIAGVATEFIIGVKSKIVAVDTAEILRRITNNNKDGQKFIKLMRALTGEIKASELIFALSRIKEDLNSTRKKGAYGDTWELLKNRAIAAKQQVRSGKHTDYSAITTVLISQADADELYREENIDITDPKIAKRFMESYNILAFIIADDSIESLKIMKDDEHNYFEELSYRQLKKDNSDDSFKKAINLLAASK